MKQDLPQPTGALLTTRRKLMQYATLLGVGSTSLLQSRDLKAAIVDGKEGRNQKAADRDIRAPQVHSRQRRQDHSRQTKLGTRSPRPET